MMSNPPDFPFASDGCSGGMSWLWRLVARRDPPWNGLCVDHDLAYWQGGSADDRRQADHALWDGVARNGHPIWADAMWLAVRLGGHPWLPLPWRWGYGYRFPRGYSRP